MSRRWCDDSLPDAGGTGLQGACQHDQDHAAADHGCLQCCLASGFM